MISRKPTYFRNSLDLRDKVQVKILRKRLKLSDEQFAGIVRKSGNSISAITKEAARATPAGPGELSTACHAAAQKELPLSPAV
ncbi:hypothetical protein UP09_27530 [Bradyrhizobium sp. LTSP885]|uniref:DUF3606 domain-containing protein n=1 Tax=Bradyrhizobium sp. LTSP885 TaxID=1619232 RepID=UPI0005C86D4A|nr:DUF3606 domain-containing protein [Bradyrhizobium sp. LTSP885]KJC37021.1 hypothetical protein UP09_27530 [Bradyrhizobium sp. LTSP885]